jgi:hypothetical protein
MKNLILTLFLLLQLPSFAQVSQQLISVDTDAGLTQKAMLSSESDNPKYLVVLIPGGNGVVSLNSLFGKVGVGASAGNFLVRSNEHFISKEVATLLVDCAHSTFTPCTNEYLKSPQRAKDVQLVISKTREKFTDSEVWLVPTSNGVLTALALGSHEGYAGVVHVSSVMFTAPGERVDFSNIKAKQFMVHHENDQCIVSQFKSAKTASEKHSIPIYKVSGGHSGAPGESCKAFSHHGFLGIEQKVVQNIMYIVKNKKVDE